MPPVGNTSHQLMITLSATIDQRVTYFTTASRYKLQELLGKHHDKHVGIRWISRCLKTLEDVGYIERQKRYTQLDNGQARQRPSMFWFTDDGATYLYDNFVKGAVFIRNKIKAHREAKKEKKAAKQLQEQSTSPGRKDSHKKKPSAKQLQEQKKFRAGYAAEQARQKRTREI